MKIRPLAGLVAGFALIARTAAADTCAEPATSADRLDDHYSYCFEDDPVHMIGTNPYNTMVRVRSRAPRTLLIRPRASFVPELLISAQGL